ncbi:MAG: J domain-containing protein [Planctomycetales bacterium]|nr:J domain-containing protein [Planctomycetales bacterium]
MANHNDYYKTLGVSRGATKDEIQKAYRQLAKKYHPDLNPDDKTAKKKFQEVQQAYDVLSDEKKRQMYDQFGPEFENIRPGPAGGGGQMPPGWEGADFSQFGGPGGAGGASAADIEELLRQFTGGGFHGGAGESFGPTPRRRGRKSTQPGADVVHEVEIPFGKSIEGGEVAIRLRRPSGEVETLTVKIPAGIESGKTIRLRGQGEPAPGSGPAGDLLVTIRVAPHSFFSREGMNLHVRVPVTIGEAALGAKVDVPTPHGTITMTIPAGTSSGKRIRAKGYGVRTKDGTRGDLYAEILITLPKSIDEASAELIRKFEAKQQESPREELKW